MTMGSNTAIGIKMASEVLLKRRLTEARRNVTTNPTPEQKEAGNYAKGHLAWKGLQITIENKANSYRSGVDSKGNKWTCYMPYDYGYIKGTKSEADGDHIDVFIGPDLESDVVFIVDQSKRNGGFDEHKVILAASNIDTAKEVYTKSFSRGFCRYSAITPLTLSQFKQWISKGDSSRPFAGQAYREFLTKTASTEEVSTTSTPDDFFKETLESKGALDFSDKAELVRRLSPTINYSLASIGADRDPVMQSKAKAMAAKSLDTYDPTSGASLATYLTGQLRSLNRDYKNYKTAVRIPDRWSFEHGMLHKAEQDFIDQHGHEPDVAELSDFTGRSIADITKVRRAYNVGTEGAFGEDLPGDAAQDDPGSLYVDDAIAYVHASVGHKDRKILEGFTGYGGKPIVPPAELALKLGISQSQVSRRVAKLALDIKELSDALNEIN